MRTPVLILVAALQAMPAKAGQSIQNTLSAEELQTELFGVHLEGVAGISDSHWSECIEPDGDTIYQFEGNERKGKAKLSAEGALCFFYPGRSGESESCFSVSRHGSDGYVFVPNKQAGILFRTETVIRNIKSCPLGPPDLG